jgi:hypothetical protein
MAAVGMSGSGALALEPSAEFSGALHWWVSQQRTKKPGAVSRPGTLREFQFRE